MGDPTEYLTLRLVGASTLEDLVPVGVGLGLGLVFEDSEEETKGRILYRVMNGDHVPGFYFQKERRTGNLLGIRPRDIEHVENGMVMPTAKRFIRYAE